MALHWDLSLWVESEKLATRVVDPFPVQRFISPTALIPQLPRSMRVHPTFHVSKVKPAWVPPQHILHPQLIWDLLVKNDSRKTSLPFILPLPTLPVMDYLGLACSPLQALARAQRTMHWRNISSSRAIRLSIPTVPHYLQ